ncbi:Uncharacterized conserved protein (UCP012943) [Abeliophyllum distichum]|uniref:Uncharacterized conserved protein (UCP012943) n=1 Tax=Abeliophyllum distichum TaxID=126358 RepID=A0ABD1UPZ5_9LAMI
MGGGIRGGGGGSMLRTVQRAVRAGVGGAQSEPFSHATNTNTSTGANSPRNTRHSYKKKQSALTLISANNTNVSSTFSSLVNLPVSATPNAATTWGSCSSPTWNDESEWECVDSSEDEKEHAFFDDFVFGTVPSRDEVQHAVSALQQVFSPASFSSLGKEKLGQDFEKDEVNSQIGYRQILSSAESKVDWIEPSLHLFNSRMLQPRGADRVYDAFHLLQTETGVQRMVLSLSSDKSVWDAVLNNEVVQELRGSLNQDPADKSPTATSLEGSDDSNPAKDILSWIIVNTRAKIMQLIDKITELVNELFEPREREKSRGSTDPLEEILKTSFFLSIMVLLVVVMTRAQSA